MNSASHHFWGSLVARARTAVRVLSIEALVLITGTALSLNGALTLLQGLYGGSRTTPFRPEVVALGRDTLLAGLVWMVVTLGVVRWRHGRFWPPPIPEESAVVRRALLCGVIGWLILMLVPPTIALSRNPYHGVIWLAWGLEDYRWLISGYLLTIFSVVALPPLAACALSGRAEPSEVGPSRIHGTKWARPLAVVIAAGIALLLFAPPWNIELSIGQVGNHDVHLSQLQAIHTGAVPYVGPASIQYGPGSQLLQYAYMSLSGRFSMLGYRETYAVFTMLAFAIFVATSVGAFGLRIGTLAALLALCVSPFAMFGWGGPMFVGAFGWGNPFRYLGTFLLLALLPGLLRQTRTRWNLSALLVGVCWGLFCWISQENLATSVMASGLFLLTSWALGTYSVGQIARVVAWCITGWMVFWVPVLAYYLAVGEVSRFLESYTLVQRFVAAGMSNTSWDPKVNLGWSAAFYLTPFVLIAAAWSTIFDWRSRRFRAGLCHNRQTLLGVTCATLVCFTGALLRKDSSHFINVLIGLPVVLAALASQTASEDLPLWSRLVVLVLLAGFVAQFPGAERLLHFPRDYVVQPWQRFDRTPHPSPWAREPGVAFERAGAFVDDNYPIYERAAPARDFLEEMNQVHALVGDRSVFVHSYPAIPPEIVYFFADLRPGPVLFNVSTMVFNTDVQARFLEHMQMECASFNAVIGTDASAREVAIFKRCHPSVIEIPRTIDGHQYFIWLSAPA